MKYEEFRKKLIKIKGLEDDCGHCLDILIKHDPDMKWIDENKFTLEEAWLSSDSRTFLLLILPFDEKKALAKILIDLLHLNPEKYKSLICFCQQYYDEKISFDDLYKEFKGIYHGGYESISGIIFCAAVYAQSNGTNPKVICDIIRKHISLDEIEDSLNKIE